MFIREFVTSKNEIGNNLREFIITNKGLKDGAFQDLLIFFDGGTSAE